MTSRSSNKFDDAIPDFDAPITRSNGPDEKLPEPEPVVSMHPDELEALKQEAFNKGKEEGVRETHESLMETFGCAIKTVIDTAESRQKADSELFQKTSEGFTETISYLLGFLSDQGIDDTSFKRDIANDTSDLIESIKSDVTVKCSSDDIDLLREYLDKHDNIKIIDDDSLHSGDIRVSWDESSISISSDDWKKKVHKQITDTVYSISQKQSEMKD